MKTLTTRTEREDELMRLMSQYGTVQERVISLFTAVRRGDITPAEGYNALWLMGMFPSISS